MKCFLSLFLSLFLSECRTFINMDLNSNTDTADHEAVTPSQPKIKYFWKKKHYSQRKYWPEKQEEVKTRKNMKPTKGRDSKTNSKVANDDEGMTLSYSIIQIPVFNCGSLDPEFFKRVCPSFCLKVQSRSGCKNRVRNELSFFSACLFEIIPFEIKAF